MKHKFIRYAPMINSRHMRAQRASGGVCYLEDAVTGEASNPPDTRTEDELLARIDTRITNSLKGTATKAELEAIRKAQKESLSGLPLDALRQLADVESGAMAVLTRQGLEIQRMQTQMDQNKPGEDMSIRGQVSRWMEDNKAQIEAVRSGSRNVSLKPLNIRAVASPMTVGTVNTTASPFIGRVEMEPGINPILRLQPNFWDFLTKGRTNAETYGWVNMTNPQGAAAFIAPGTLKPGISFSMVPEFSHAKKVADSAKAVTELLQDIDGMVTFIEQELRFQVMIKVNSVLMTSAGSSTEPTGIQNLSVAYNLGAGVIHTTDPTQADALRAVVAQLRSGLLQGDITIFINSIDAANMDLAKAQTSGVYLLPPFVTSDNRTISGARVVEDNNIPVGSFQAGFMRFYRILIYQDFNVSWGWENDDFTKNMVTAVGEMRLHQFFNSRYTGAFVFDTYDNVKALIAE